MRDRDKKIRQKLVNMAENLEPAKLPEGYEYVQEISKGAQGEIWLVYNNNMDRHEAVKILLHEASRERFSREIKNIAKLDHPNIVTIYFANLHQFYFIMEYLQGGSLRDHINTGTLSIDEKIQIIKGVADGLYFAHQQDVIHRDLKPQNIIFSANMTPKIADFGLAKSSENHELTASHVLIGSPCYMAPEQWRNSKELDHRCDIWALGIVLYEVLMGKPPFMEKTAAELMYSILSRPVTFSSNKKLSNKETGLTQICFKALAKNPKHRYQNAKEMSDALNELYENVPIRTANPIPSDKKENKLAETRRMHRDKPSETSYKLKSPIAKKKKKRRKGTLVILLLLAALALTIFFVPNASEKVEVFVFKSTKKLLQFFKKENEKNSTKQTQKTNKIEGLEIWKPCWNGKFLDFTHPVWEKLTFSKKIRYAQSYQRWYAQKRKLKTQMSISIRGISFTMVLIPPGRFWIGASKKEKERLAGEKPRYRATIAQSFWMGQTEITQKQWHHIVKEKPWQGKPYAKSHAENAANYVSWYKINRKFLPTLGDNFFLPTEIQWEYAARAGTSTRFYWGDDLEGKEISKYAWHNKDFEKIGTKYPQTVAKKLPNPWGLYDISGNVWEWCLNRKEKYPLTQKKLVLKMGKKQSYRGGSWISHGKSCRSAARGGANPKKGYSYVGFRIILIEE